MIESSAKYDTNASHDHDKHNDDCDDHRYFSKVNLDTGHEHGIKHEYGIKHDDDDDDLDPTARLMHDFVMGLKRDQYDLVYFDYDREMSSTNLDGRFELESDVVAIESDFDTEADVDFHGPTSRHKLDDSGKRGIKYGHSMNKSGYINDTLKVSGSAGEREKDRCRVGRESKRECPVDSDH
ncbi:Meiotically up-regulated protein 70 protein [Sphaceloma murrayae]|uniref:Meiotically up-regulated protein 70 protein n=1 Tax=Sphaceloma murrayae TaxID=2082308 RepID=A0A2K1QPR2_9PEZI|nr:Meiotically up-regulated protein 70 protein [Sphaceloma murrayae]